MLLKTHIAVGIAAALYFLPHMNDKLIFAPTVLVASILPEIGNILFAKKGHKYMKVFKSKNPLGGITRTYTTCILVSIILAVIYPILAFPFFLGYSFNLFLNTFSTEGIRPFWPLKNKTSGHIATGGNIDLTIFILFLIFDLALVVKIFIT
jgi:membrane-bound metal-dependent hydrolase YbcI (DUF457 family)